MKKIFFGVAAAALLLNVTGCENEDVVLQQEGAMPQEFTLQAEYGTATRTTLEEGSTGGYNTLWSAGDQIYVSDESGEVTGVLTLTEGEGKTSGTFKGVVCGDPSTLKYAIFPVPENGVIDLSKVDAGQVDAPMTADINGGQANFANACGLVRLNIYNPGDAAIKLSATGISGTLRVEGGKLVSGTPSNEIAIENVQSGQAFFVPVVAGETATSTQFTLTVGDNTTTFEANTKNGSVSVTGVPEKIYITDDQIVDVTKGLTDAIKQQETIAETAAEITKFIDKGETTIKLWASDEAYVIPAAAKGKTVEFVGTGNPEDVKVAVTKVGSGGENCDYGLDGSTVTFDGITITTNSSTYIGYARCKGTYKNCIINGTYTLYGNSTFEDCTFNVSGDVYNIWTWGAPEATFTRCTFNSDGKAMLLYGTANTKLTINSSVFNDNGGLADLKAAVEIGNDYGKSYELIVNNTVVNGYEINDKGINTGTTLWANKNSMGTDKLNVVVDGVDVY